MSRKTKTPASRDTPPPAAPRRWDDLFGFEAPVRQMQELMLDERWPQVVLLEGREGIGKRKLLAQLCGLIFCEERRACASCAGCRALVNGYQPDLLWIETEGPIKVAEAEQIQEHLTYRASHSSTHLAWRVVVLVDIENMSDQAANRLLKTLEEPPAQTRILLSCSRPRQLLPTIASRLVRWHLQPPKIEESLAWLSAKAQAAGLSQDKQWFKEVLEAHGLAPGRSWRYLEQEHQGLPAVLATLQQILLQPFDGQRLQELQDLLKQQGWKADEFAQQFELILNRCYKASLGLSAEAAVATPDLPSMRHWRRILQQVYRAGGRNYLNTQMVAEALGL